MAVLFVMDHVLVRVTVVGRETGWGSKEVLERGDDCGIEYWGRLRSG